MITAATGAATLATFCAVTTGLLGPPIWILTSDPAANGPMAKKSRQLGKPPVNAVMSSRSVVDDCVELKVTITGGGLHTINGV